MKTSVIVNPKAASGKVGRGLHKLRRKLAEQFGTDEIDETQRAGDATRMVRAAIDKGAERVVVVGGDGTFNEGVNGFFDTDNTTFIGEGVEFAPVPVGTGGDFARSLGLSGGLRATRGGGYGPRTIDVGRASFENHRGNETSRHFLNISSFGSSGEVVDRVNRTSKTLGGRASFLVGTIRGMLGYQNQRVRLRIDEKFEEDLLVNTVAVANGRYFGGGMKIAPGARVDDGHFDIVVLGDVGVGYFVRHSPKLYRGEHLELPAVRSFTGKTVTASALGRADVLIDLDGEQPGRLPVKYEMLPNLLKVAAPWERAEALG